MYLHAYSGELAHRLPTLPPVDNQPWMRPYTWASWRKLTSVVSCRQAALDMYLDTCFGKLAQPLPALRPLTIGSDRCWTSWRSTNRRCLLLTTGQGCAPLLHPLRTSHKCCTHTRASWRSTYRRHLEHAGNQGRSSWPRTQIVQPASCGCTSEPYACAYTGSGLTPFAP